MFIINNMKYYERTKAYPQQLKGTATDAFLCDCEASKTNPLSLALNRAEKKSKKKPKLDEFKMFEGLQKPKRKVKHRPRKKPDIFKEIY